MGQILGLVGYYRVTEVSSYIERGTINTQLKANWEAAGDGKSRSIIDQVAALRNCLCGGANLPTVQETINLRNIYTKEDIIVLTPDVNENYCDRSLASLRHTTIYRIVILATFYKKI